MPYKCIYCGGDARYGPEGTKERITCRAHKLDGYINTDESRKCIVCGKRPNHGPGPKGSKPIRCSEHKLGTDIPLVNLCVYKDCLTIKTFGYPDGKPIHCLKHIENEEEEIDLVHKKCIRCTGPMKDRIRPTFGIPGTKQPISCRKHKLPEEVDVANRICKHCKTRASFGDPDEQMTLRCKKHSLPGDINLNGKKCGMLGCPRFALYGNAKDGIVRTCGKHCDKETDICLRTKKCKVCKVKQPCYGFLDDSISTHCAGCRLSGQVNVRSITCEECNSIASYGDPNIRKKIHCKEHILPGEIDLGNKPCTEPGCDKYAVYGKLFENKTKCSEHRNLCKDKLTYYRRTHPQCYVKDCPLRPYYSTGCYPRSCEIHVRPGEINITERKCADCGLKFHIPVSRTLCDYCMPMENKIYKDKQINTSRGLKESRVADLLNERSIKYESWDQVMPGSCSKYRPDFVIDTPYYKILVEVDEHMHKAYDEVCQLHRTVQLMYDSGMEQILIIRYNPDNYVDDKGKKNTDKLSSREDKLIETINRYIAPTSYLDNLGVNLIYLYYNKYNGSTNIMEVVNFA